MTGAGRSGATFPSLPRPARARRSALRRAALAPAPVRVRSGVRHLLSCPVAVAVKVCLCPVERRAGPVKTQECVQKFCNRTEGSKIEEGSWFGFGSGPDREDELRNRICCGGAAARWRCCAASGGCYSSRSLARSSSLPPSPPLLHLQSSPPPPPPPFLQLLYKQACSNTAAQTHTTQ